MLTVCKPPAPSESQESPQQKHLHIKLRLRARCLRQHGKLACRYCGRHLSKHAMTVDHVIPKVHGGTDDDDNLVLACNLCNTSKGGLSLEDWAGQLQQMLREVQGMLGSSSQSEEVDLSLNVSTNQKEMKS